MRRAADQAGPRKRCRPQDLAGLEQSHGAQERAQDVGRPVRDVVVGAQLLDRSRIVRDHGQQIEADDGSHDEIVCIDPVPDLQQGPDIGTVDIHRAGNAMWPFASTSSGLVPYLSLCPALSSWEGSPVGDQHSRHRLELVTSSL